MTSFQQKQIDWYKTVYHLLHVSSWYIPMPNGYIQHNIDLRSMNQQALIMLPFRPAAGSIVAYDDTYKQYTFLITGYNYDENFVQFYPYDGYEGENIAQLIDLDTGNPTCIIMQFGSGDYITYNSNLTLIG